MLGTEFGAQKRVVVSLTFTQKSLREHMLNSVFHFKTSAY